LSNKEFVTWRDSDTSAPLLVVAPPGRGKSVLSNYVLGHLESLAHYNTTATTKTIYHFCNIKNDETAWNARSLLRALIVQLCECQQRLFDLLLTEYKTRSESFLNAPFDTLWHIFEQMLQDEAYGRINCIIDGLDVYQDGMDELIDKLFATVPRLRARKGPVLKFFCTSRSGTHLNKWPFKYQVVLRCKPQDLDCFINSQISDLGQGFTGEMRHVIKRECSAQTKEDKTFLWLEVVFRKIKMITLPNIQRITDTIRKSSLDLFKLYEDLIHEFRDDKDVLRLLAWVAYAKKRMDLASLEDALAVHLKDQCTTLQSRKLKRAHLTVEEVFKACGTILDVIEDKVYFIHQSVKDYLDKEDPLRTRLGVPLRLVPAYACLTYLSSEDFHQQRYDFHNFPFLGYAQKCWHLHIKSTADIIGSTDLQSLLIQLIAPSKLKSWSYRLRLLESDHVAWTPENFVWYHETKFRPVLTSEIALYYDIGWLAKLLLNNSISELPNDFPADCLLKAAHRQGHVLRVLLEHDSGVFFRLDSQFVEFIAIKKNHVLFELLLKKRGREIRIDSKIAAAAAANFAYAKEVMEVLFQNGGDNTLITSDLLEIAVRNARSDKRLLELLFDQSGDEVRITSNVLLAAAKNNGIGWDTMKLLFSKLKDETKITQNVVKAAAGHKSCGRHTMKLLIDRGVPVGVDALEVAAQNPRDGLEIVKLLYNERRHEVHVTANVLAAAAYNWGHGDKILALLLSDPERHAAGLCITDDTVTKAVGNYGCSWEILHLLFSWRPKEVRITKKVQTAIERVMQYDQRDARLITIFMLERCAEDTQITADIVERILKLFSIDVTDLSRERCGDSNITSWHVMRLISKHEVYLVTLAGKLDQLEALLTLGPDPNYVSNDGWTPLTLAVFRGDLRTVELLLANKAEPSMVTKIGFSPLDLAAGNGHVEIIRLLLDRGAVIDEGGLRLLTLASSRGRVEVIKFLLERRVDVNATDHDGWTPLAAASDSGQFSAVEVLVENNADLTARDKTGNTPLISAAREGHVKVLKYLVEHLLEKAADISGSASDDWTPLSAASSNGHLATVEFLLSQGANPLIVGQIGYSPLDAAAANGHVEIVKTLLEQGVDISSSASNAYTPLGLASGNGHLETVELLLSKGANPLVVGRSGWSPLDLAAESSHVEIVKALLTHESFHTVDKQHSVCGTIANTLAYTGHTDLLQYIVQQKHADLQTPDSLMRTPLLFAARGGRIQTFEYLVGQELPLDMIDAKGDGLISYAASSGCLQLLEVVLEKGLEYSPQPGRWSPLHWACRSGDVQTVTKVLETTMVGDQQTGPITEVDVEGERTREWTPRAIAIFHGNGDMLEDLSEPDQVALGVGNAIVDVQGNSHELLCEFCLHVCKRLVIV
jgi:ankyrin repeat protein